MARTLEHAKYAVQTNRIDLGVELVLGVVGGIATGLATENVMAGIGAGVGTAAIVWGGFFLVRLMKAPNEIAANDRRYKDDAYNRLYKENIRLNRAKNVAREFKNDPVLVLQGIKATLGKHLETAWLLEFRNDGEAGKFRAKYRISGDSVERGARDAEHDALWGKELDRVAGQTEIANGEHAYLYLAEIGNRRSRSEKGLSIRLLSYHNERELRQPFSEQWSSKDGREKPSCTVELTVYSSPAMPDGPWKGSFILDITGLHDATSGESLKESLAEKAEKHLGGLTESPPSNQNESLFAASASTALTPPNEREAIERIRVLWRSEGHDASWSALELFSQIKSDLECRTSLAELLQAPLDNLQASRNAMKVCVSNESTATLDEVCQCFGEFYQKYRVVFGWFHKLEQGIVVTEAAYAEKHAQWHERATRLDEELLRVLNRSDSTELSERLRQHGVWVPQNG